MSSLYIMTLPHLGEGVKDAEVSEVLVSPGDKVQKEDPVVVLESEKASMEIPSDVSGTIVEVFSKEGETVFPGDKIISIQEKETTTKEKPIKVELKTKKQKNKTNSSLSKEEQKETQGQQRTNQTFRTSPSVRKLARELKINLSEIKGSGEKERITRSDLINEIKKRINTKTNSVGEEIDFSQWGTVYHKPLSKIKKITGERLERAWREIPQVTQFDIADITELDKYRKKTNTENTPLKRTFLPFLIRAVTQTLKEFPSLNSSLSVNKEFLVHKKYYHIGVAIDTAWGLVVPVIKNTDKKNTTELSIEMEDLSKRAREKKLKPEELKGGTFTISSLGGIGGTYFSPIVNPPEVAILGVSRARWKPTMLKGKKTFTARYILPFSLTYDHRVVDGAQAAAFTQYLAKVMSNTSFFE